MGCYSEAVRPDSCPLVAEGLKGEAESGFVHVSYLQQDTRLPAAWRTQWLCPNLKALPWCLLTWSALPSDGRSHSKRRILNAGRLCGTHSDVWTSIITELKSKAGRVFPPWAIINLTMWGESVDWKCISAPMTDICSSHLRLVSMPSSWYSPALLKRDLSAAKTCSARVQRAPVAAWQKITSRLSCREVSGDEEKQRAVKVLKVEALLSVKKLLSCPSYFII